MIHERKIKSVGTNLPAFAGVFSRTEGSVRGDAKKPGLCSQQYPHHATQAKNEANALAQMTASIWDPDGEVDRGLKRLIAHVASRTAGCQYCMAHTAEGALHFGVEEKKLAAVWDYQTSPLFSAAERAALDLAVAGAAVPNVVTDDMFVTLRKYWTEDQIVEIVGVIAMFGFLNRWNDTLATPLEDEPIATGEKYLSSHGWSPGKHRTT